MLQKTKQFRFVHKHRSVSGKCRQIPRNLHASHITRDVSRLKKPEIGKFYFIQCTFFPGLNRKRDSPLYNYIICYIYLYLHKSAVQSTQTTNPASQFDQMFASLVLLAADGAILESLQIPVHFSPNSLFFLCSNLLIMISMMEVMASFSWAAIIPRVMTEFSFCVHFNCDYLKKSLYYF